MNTGARTSGCDAAPRAVSSALVIYCLTALVGDSLRKLEARARF